MGKDVQPTDVTVRSAPRRRTDLTVVELDDELVIYEPDDRAMHKLDRIATALWQCFDGATTVEELVEDLADMTEESRDRLEADVLGYVRELAAAGLLEDVS